MAGVANDHFAWLLQGFYSQPGLCVGGGTCTVMSRIKAGLIPVVGDVRARLLLVLTSGF